MKKTPSSSRRQLKQSTLFDYSSPTKESPSAFDPPASTSKSKKSGIRATQTPRKLSQARIPVTPRSKNPPALTFVVSDDEDSSEDINRIKLEGKDTSSGSSSSSSSSSNSSSSDDDDSHEVPRPTQGKRLQKLRALVEEDTSEAEEEPQPAKARAKRRASKAKSPESDEEEEEQVAPKRRRLTRARSTSVSKKEKGSDGEEDEDDDDLDEKYILEDRLRERGKKTPFQKNLEKLRRKKQKLPNIASSEEEDEEEKEEEDEKPARSKPFKGAKPGLFDSGEGEDGSDSDSSGDNDVTMASEEADDSFIVDDGSLGAPILPAEFSMETHQDLSHQFKKIFQFFVHIAVQPPGKRKEFMKHNMEHEEYFHVPLLVTRRKLNGLRDSLVASSVWRPEFKKALEKYPEFTVTHLEFAIPHCDACRLGNRVSKYGGTLGGVPYDRMGFRPLKGKKHKDDSDSDSDSDSSSSSSSSDSDCDESDSSTEDLKKEFNFGRFCARRTQVYHQFSHWEYELFSCIDRELDELRQNQAKKKGKKFYKVAYAGGKAPPEDLTDADELVEWMDERRVIDQEWQTVKVMMESARHLEMDAKKGDQD